MEASTTIAPRASAATRRRSRTAADTEPPATTASSVWCSATACRASAAVKTPTTAKPLASSTALAARIFSGDRPTTTTVQSAAINPRVRPQANLRSNDREAPPYHPRRPCRAGAARRTAPRPCGTSEHPAGHRPAELPSWLTCHAGIAPKNERLDPSPDALARDDEQARRPRLLRLDKGSPLRCQDDAHGSPGGPTRDHWVLPAIRAITHVDGKPIRSSRRRRRAARWLTTIPERPDRRR